MKGQKIVTDLVDFEHIALDQWGTARVVGPGINAPCRCRHTLFRYDVWFEHDGKHWQGHRFTNNGRDAGKHYRVSARAFGAPKHESPYDRAIVPDDIMQASYAIFGQAVQKLLQELVNRGWKIEPPKK